jgi:tRNA threonylcarbamoyladenosine biosynthesis protein TsaB
MRILAVDTSHPQGTVALLRADSRIETVRLEKPASHLVDLAKAVAALVPCEAPGGPALDRLAIVTGPGSFTGLRIGMAFIKGLYAALGCSVVTMTSLELLYRQTGPADVPVAVMIDARKDEVYAVFYPPDQSGKPSVPRAVGPAEFLTGLPVSPTVFIGSGALRYRDLITSVFGTRARFPEDAAHVPDAGVLCRLAASLPALPPEDVVSLEPCYIRPSDVKLKPLGSVRSYDR